MTTITMTSKGQVTLPAATRAKLRLVAGSKIDVRENEHGEIVLRPKTGDIRSLKDFFKYRGPVKTLEEIDDGIAAAVAERALRR
jgi:antitoxin PrlF